MSVKFVIAKNKNSANFSWTVIAGWLLLSVLMFPITIPLIDSFLVFGITEFILLVISFIIFRFHPTDSILILKQQVRKAEMDVINHEDNDRIDGFRNNPKIKQIIKLKQNSSGRDIV